jgi:hypothetical protein
MRRGRERKGRLKGRDSAESEVRNYLTGGPDGVADPICMTRRATSASPLAPGGGGLARMSNVPLTSAMTRSFPPTKTGSRPNANLTGQPRQGWRMKKSTNTVPYRYCFQYCITAIIQHIPSCARTTDSSSMKVTTTTLVIILSFSDRGEEAQLGRTGQIVYLGELLWQEGPAP